MSFAVFAFASLNPQPSCPGPLLPPSEKASELYVLGRPHGDHVLRCAGRGDRLRAKAAEIARREYDYHFLVPARGISRAFRLGVTYQCIVGLRFCIVLPLLPAPQLLLLMRAPSL